MSTITLTVGAPGSGKSTWAKDQVEKNKGYVVRVNMDDIREMIGLPYSKAAEDLALSIQDKAILSAISAGHHVIVDNCHATDRMPNRIKKLFDGDVHFQVKSFADEPLGHCLERNQNRDRTVPEDAVRRIHNQIHGSGWKLTEEWMNDYMFPLEPYVIQDNEVPLCVVFDIDGNLARHHRSPFDYSRVGSDSVFENVKQILDFYWDNHYSVFLCSGRPDVWRGMDIRGMTEEWLSKHNIRYDHLFMRNGITQADWNDADVKHNIFNEEFRNDYEIENWFDDRDRVVRRMRKLGVNVVQVASGDF